MEEGKKKRAFGVTFAGSVTFQGPMFDIHDNEHIHLSVEKLPSEAETDELMEMATDITQPPQEDELNYFQPQLHLKRLFAAEWFELCRTKDAYTQEWGEGIIDALMASKWRDNIARDWSVKRKRTALIGYIMGVLKDAGVLKGSYGSIAKKVGIIVNEESKRDPYKTFADYMARGKKQPYALWVKESVGKMEEALKRV